MNNRLQNFLRVLESLDREKVQYILVGGVAVILHGIERLTRDILKEISEKEKPKKR